jgi:hypothetical protein
MIRKILLSLILVLLLNITACMKINPVLNIEPSTKESNTIQITPSLGQENNKESDIIKTQEVVKDGKAVEFTDNDIFVLGIKLDMDKSELESILGQPIKSESHYEEAFGTDVLNYIYKFGEIRLEPIEEKLYTVSNIIINKSNYSGPRDIKVGDNIETVLRKFPYNEKASKDEDGEKYVYGNLGENNGVITYNRADKIEEVKYSFGNDGFGTYTLRIRVENDKVMSISISVLNI